jgi:hypothetical protein
MSRAPTNGPPVFSPDVASSRSPRKLRTAGLCCGSRLSAARRWMKKRQASHGDRQRLCRLRDCEASAPPSDIHLRADASVTVVKHASLASYRVVYFATHGLVAGDIHGVAEPALALSIPGPWRTTACSPRARSRSSSSMPTGDPLVRRLQRGHSADHHDLRLSQGRSSTWPRRSPAARHARLHE